MQKYFITEQDVKDHTDVQQNVDNKSFEPRLVRCQEKYIQPLLGEALYEELCLAHEKEQQEQPVAMSDELDELLEKIVPVMAQWVYYTSLPFIYVKTTNAGMKGTSEASDADKRIHASAVKTEAEDRSNSLKDWLEKNKSKYPNYLGTPKIIRIPGGLHL